MPTFVGLPSLVVCVGREDLRRTARGRDEEAREIASGGERGTGRETIGEVDVWRHRRALVERGRLRVGDERRFAHLHRCEDQRLHHRFVRLAGNALDHRAEDVVAVRRVEILLARRLGCQASAGPRQLQ